MWWLLIKQAADKFWPHGVAAIAAAGMMWVGCSWWYGWTIDDLNTAHEKAITKLEKDHEDALAFQKQLLTAQRAAAERVTEEVSHAYQERISDLSRRVVDVKRMQPNACIPVVERVQSAGGAGGANGAAGGDVQPGRGIDLYAFTDYRGDAQLHVEQVIGLQQLVCELYKLNGKTLQGCPTGGTSSW